LLHKSVERDGWPLIGKVAAGKPLMTEVNVEQYCKLGPELFQHKADYLLRVQGSSMRDAGILDGDLLVVQQATEARSGQIVVARLHDEVTVKTLRLAGALAYLEPANPEFPVLIVDLSKQELSIEGIVVGVIRNRID
jgi:repressor LexA